MKILVTGSTGFIGSHLVHSLIKDGHQLYLPVRNTEKAQTKFQGSQVHIIDWPSINLDFCVNEKKIDAVINLLGENIASKKWTNERKKSLYNSRVDGTSRIIEILNKQDITVDKFVQCSATGIYGTQATELVDESSPYGEDFLARLCVDWEKALFQRKDQFKDVAVIRTGMVLGKNGGAVDKMLPIFKFGLGGKLGSGKQFVSWIHIYDLVNLYKLAMSSEDYSGIINATSFYPVTNNEFTQVLCNLLRKKKFFGVPARLLRMALGELSSVLLTGARVEPKVLREQKFHYMFPTIEVALKEVVSK